MNPLSDSLSVSNLTRECLFKSKKKKCVYKLYIYTFYSTWNLLVHWMQHIITWLDSN